MKILFITAKYYPDGAGAGRSVRNSAESMAQHGHDVVVLTLSKTSAKSEEVIDGVRIIKLPLRNIYYPGARSQPAFKRFLWHIIDSCNIWAARDVGQVLDAEKPDIVNTNIIAGFGPLIFQAIKARGIKLVHTLRDYYMLCPQSAMFKGGKDCESICASCKPFSVMRAGSGRHVDLFLSNSDYVADRHKQLSGICEGRALKVQYNMNEDDEIALPSATIDRYTIRFGYIGRISPEKGLSVVLDACKNLATEDYTLTIAGQGDEAHLDSLKQQAQGNPIEFIGFTAPEDFFAQIDVLICPSLYAEPLPRVIYEAYRAAIPVIAARNGGIVEIVDEGGTGFLYTPHDIDALSAYMMRFMTGDANYEALSKGAAKKAKSFTKTMISREYIKHIEALYDEDHAS